MKCFRTEGCYWRYFPQDNQVERASLFGLSYTCKRLNRLVRPLLFHDVRMKTGWQERHFIYEFIERNRWVTERMRYYRGTDPEILETLLCKLLHLHHLTIPPLMDWEETSHQSHGWMENVPKNLIVQEVRLTMHTWRDASALEQMHVFKGLKTLCIDLVWDGSEFFCVDYVDLSKLSCPELEHLALLSVCKIFPISLNGLPKLQSLYVEVVKNGSDLEYPEDDETLWDTIMALRDRGTYFFFEYEDKLDYDETNEWWPSSRHWFFLEDLLAYADSAELDPDPLIEWFILSVFFFADYFNLPSDPETAVEIDLRMLSIPDHVAITLDTMKSLESLPNRAVWARFNIRHSEPLHKLVNSMPTNICFLDIEITAEARPIQLCYISAIISALPHLCQLRIYIDIPSHCPYSITPDEFTRFTNSPFASLFPSSKGRRHLVRLIMIPGHPPQGSTITPHRLEENREFFAEVSTFFDLSPTLREIELRLWVDY
jgi:hypothetical protein